MPRYGHLVRCTNSCEDYKKDTDYTVGSNITEAEANRLFAEYPKCWAVLRFNSAFKLKNPKPVPQRSFRGEAVQEIGEVLDEMDREEEEKVKVPEVKTTGLTSPKKSYRPSWYGNNLESKDD